MKILVVDDDVELLPLIAFAMRQAGFLTLEARTGTDVLRLVTTEQPDLVILDVNLPGMSGFEACRALRDAGQRVPVLLLTVRDSEDDLVHGLDHGADDYLTKPFSPRELLARARALLRRAGLERARRRGTGDLELDDEFKAVRVAGGESRRLTDLEFRLLQVLMAHAGHPVPYERILAHVWGAHARGDRQILKQLVHRLRQKIEEDPADPQRLCTEPGIGYRLCDDEPPAKSAP